MEFLTRKFGPFPVYVWALVIVGGIVLAIYIRSRTQNSSGGSQTAATNPFNPTNDPNIDPNTGVPYALEEQIDPNTGVPYYYEQNYGGTNNPTNGTTNNPPTNPPPVTAPPTGYKPGPVPKHPFAPNPPGHDPFDKQLHPNASGGTTAEANQPNVPTTPWPAQAAVQSADYRVHAA